MENEKEESKIWRFLKDYGASILLVIVLIVGVATERIIFPGIQPQTTGIYITPSVCDDECEELRDITKGLVKEAGLKFREVNYSAAIPMPGFFILSNTQMTGIVGLENEDSVKTYLCDSVGEFCINKTTTDVEVKSNKPTVELFVMSHCPYGIQIEKGILPVIEQLNDSVDFQLKFVDYAMHGKKEVVEQIRQRCIDLHQKDKLFPYLYCFTVSGNSEYCKGSAGINQTALTECMEDIELEYALVNASEDKNTYVNGRFPKFTLDGADNTRYNVRGSPTLIVNGQQVSSTRDSQSLLDAICNSFYDAPEACYVRMETKVPSPGFGVDLDDTNASSTAECS